MKRCFAKNIFVTVAVVAISLANVSECKAFVYFNLFGFGAGYQPYSQAGYSPSAYGNYHNTGYGYNGHYGAGYRNAYHSPRGSYYHAPMNSYGWGGYSTGYRGFFGGSWRGFSSCGRRHHRSRCNTGCSTSHYPVNQCSTSGGYTTGQCATGQCDSGGYNGGGYDAGRRPENTNTQSPTPLKTYDDNDVPDPRKSEKYKRPEREEEIDKTGSEQFRRSRDAGEIEDDKNRNDNRRRNDDRRDDGEGSFGGTRGLNEEQENRRTEKRDGIGSRKSEEPKPPVLETPEQPKGDPFSAPEKTRSTFKIPAETIEGVEALDKIMDDFNTSETDATNNKTDTKSKGAPTKDPLEETPSTKKKPAEMPRLEVKPIGLGESVARRTIPNYRRLSMRSRYFAPQIARTRLNLNQKEFSPLLLQPETKLVSR